MESRTMSGFLAEPLGKLCHYFQEKRNLKKIKSPGCRMVTQMIIEVSRKAECLFDYVASLWAAYVYALHVGGVHSCLCTSLLWVK